MMVNQRNLNKHFKIYQGPYQQETTRYGKCIKYRHLFYIYIGDGGSILIKPNLPYILYKRILCSKKPWNTTCNTMETYIYQNCFQKSSYFHRNNHSLRQTHSANNKSVETHIALFTKPPYHRYVHRKLKV